MDQPQELENGKVPRTVFGVCPNKCPLVVETHTIQSYFDSLGDDNVCENLKVELCEIVDQMLTASHNRDGRRAKFDTLVCDGGDLSREGHELLKMIQGRAATHIYFMTIAWPMIYECHYKEKFPTDRPRHDHSKDGMFMFIMASHFDLKLGHPAIQELQKEELKRHYSLEAHHPEYELETGKECNEVDILEMAVDRMARNMQFDKRREGMERMKKFLPKFFLGDVVKKQEQYWTFVTQYMGQIEKLWEVTYGEQVGKLPSGKI